AGAGHRGGPHAGTTAAAEARSGVVEARTGDAARGGEGVRKERRAGGAPAAGGEGRGRGRGSIAAIARAQSLAGARSARHQTASRQDCAWRALVPEVASAAVRLRAPESRRRAPVAAAGARLRAGRLVQRLGGEVHQG